MSITFDKLTPFSSASSVCVSKDRVIPVSVSPIEFARGNGSNNSYKYPPLQISNINIDLLRLPITSNESLKTKSIPTIKLK